MKDILSIIRLKNPEDVTQKELDAFRLVIEEAQQHFDKLQTIHKELTGRNHVPPIRLANKANTPDPQNSCAHWMTSVGEFRICRNCGKVVPGG